MSRILNSLLKSLGFALLAAGALLMPLNAAESLFDTVQQQQAQTNTAEPSLIVTDAISSISPGVDNAQATNTPTTTDSKPADGKAGALDHVDPSFFRAPGTPAPQAVSDTSIPNTDSVDSQQSPTPNAAEGSGLNAQTPSPSQEQKKSSPPSGIAAGGSATQAKYETPKDHAETLTNGVAAATPASSSNPAAPVASSASSQDKNSDNKSAETSPAIPKKITPSIPVDAPPNLEEPADKMAASAPQPVAPSQNVTLNLINRLVQRGILTKEDAEDLIRQAKEDAQVASQQAMATQQAVQQAAAAQQMAIESGAPPSSDEAVSVSYVPEIVKAEMRNEIKRDVLETAQAEGWGSFGNLPDWISKFRPFMDLRTRFEGDYFPSGSSSNSINPLDTLNFNAINTSAPFNISQANGNQSPPLGYPTYNTTEDRNRLRIRFRFGADMDLGENFTSGFRIATGQNGSPVSENQTLGNPQTTGVNAQGGNFSGYAIWLDRAFLKYEVGDDPDRLAAITVGRFDNPFFTPTTIMWANDIGFDGIAAQARYKLFKGFTPFVSGGLFPVYNTDLNFASTSQPKEASYDKYLYAAQGGIDWKVTKDIAMKGSIGYYYFQNVEGQVSAPQVAYSAADQFSTDDSRPSFAQRGNTYMALRDIPATIDNDYGTINQYQYFGLATPFHILSANGRIEYRRWEPFVVSVSGEWDQNMAFNASNIENCGPTNLKGPINNPNSSGTGFGGGNNAWIAQFKIGSGALQKRWDWDFGMAYRYVESDAVIDGFCDSDFGGGGTNLKGLSIGGNLALSKHVFIGARWLSATAIAGPTFKEDILQIDLNARF